jgi:hypothetical protein
MWVLDALTVRYGFVDVVDHFLRLWSGNLYWDYPSYLGPIGDERSRLASNAGKTTQRKQRTQRGTGECECIVGCLEYQGDFVIPSSGAAKACLIDNRQHMQSMTATLAVIRHLGVLIRVTTLKIERQFSRFADVPYQDPLEQQNWKDLWQKDL